MANYDPVYGGNPADSAMPYLQQVPGTLTPYFNPYVKTGKAALAGTMNQYARLIHDPAAVMNNMGSGYQQSPGYDYEYSQAQDAANNSAAAGGMLGTPQNQEESATAAGHVADQDYWNYMSHVLNMYGQGLSGMQHVSDTGYKASSTLAEDLAKNLESEAGLAFKGQAEQNKANGDFWGGIMGTMGSVGAAAIPYAF